VLIDDAEDRLVVILQTGPVLERAEVVADVQMARGLRNGRWTEWYKNGNRRATGTYRNDLLDGTTMFWFENGSRWAQKEYVRGQRDGTWIFWDQNGDRTEVRKYRDGLLVKSS